MSFRVLVVSLFMTLFTCRAEVAQEIERVDPDYGILSESDKTRGDFRLLMWRCFPVKDVRVESHTFRDADSMGPSDVIVTMCDFEIKVRSKPYSNIYSGRRAKEVTYCNNFKKAWTKLTQGEEYICLEGVSLTKGVPEEDSVSKEKVVSWTWNKIKTKKGCYGFWDAYKCANFE